MGEADNPSPSRSHIGQSFARSQVLAEILPLVRLGRVTAEAIGRDPGDRGWGCVPSLGGTTSQLNRQQHHFNMRSHQSAVRQWSGRFRLDFESCHVGGIAGHGRWRCSPSICFSIPQLRLNVSICGRTSLESHEIIQGENSEQGDPLMPALFAVGQHRALVATSERLLLHEHHMAFLDDIYVVSSGALGPHSPPDEGTIVASRPDSDPPRQNSGLEPGSDGAKQH